MNQAEQESNPYAAPLTTAIPADYPSSDIETTRRYHLSHEASLRSFGTLYLIGGVLSLLVGVAMAVTSLFAIINTNANAVELLFPVAIGSLYLVLGSLQVWVAMGLRKLSSAGRIGATVVATIGLVAIPVGTLISAYLLYLLWSKKGNVIFTPEYREIREKTPHIRYKTSIVVWIFVGLLVLVIGASIVALMFG